MKRNLRFMAAIVMVLALAALWPTSLISAQEATETMEINTAQDLLLFAEEVNSGNTTLNADLAADLDLSDICNESSGSWTPIREYEGTFNGNGHVIHGLYCVLPEESLAGLFGSASGDSHIKDLNMEDVHVEGNKYAAGVVANSWGEVSGCSVSGYVKGKEYAAGVCAASGSVSDCVNYADVVCDNGEESFTNGRCGGVAGEVTRYAKNCTNYGTVTGMEWVTAGVIGGTPKSGGSPIRTIENCFNHGVVDGYLHAGGVAGYVYNTVIQKCGNDADISGMAYVGGVVSGTSDRKSSCLIINCYNKGNLVGKDWGEGNDAILTGGYDYVDEQRVGGIVSAFYLCYICNCYSWGSAQSGTLYRSTSAGIAASSDEYHVGICNSYSNMELSNAYGWEPEGIGLDGTECDNCFYVNGGQSLTGWETTMEPGQPESWFLDGTVTSSLNSWPTQETDSSYTECLKEFGAERDEWVQGEFGPVFIWE